MAYSIKFMNWYRILAQCLKHPILLSQYLCSIPGSGSWVQLPAVSHQQSCRLYPDELDPCYPRGKARLSLWFPASATILAAADMWEMNQSQCYLCFSKQSEKPYSGIFYLFLECNWQWVTEVVACETWEKRGLRYVPGRKPQLWLLWGKASVRTYVKLKFLEQCCGIAREAAACHGVFVPFSISLKLFKQIVICLTLNGFI